MTENQNNGKNDNVKVVYGNENLKEIVTELLEQKFIDTIKKSENKWKVINLHILLWNI